MDRPDVEGMIDNIEDKHKAAQNRADLLDYIAHLEAQLQTAGDALGVLEDIRKAYLSEWHWPGPQCACHDDYATRSRVDPGCMYHQSPEVWDALKNAIKTLRRE